MKKKLRSMVLSHNSESYCQVLRFSVLIGLMVFLPLSTYGTYSAPGASDLLTLQQVRISGTITDSNTGEPLAGVNIVAVGTITGTNTDANGKYSLNVANLSGTLQISFIGYITQGVAIGGRTTINVSLVQEVTALS